jgi:thiosulfate reductase cytochrome b subunit
MGEDSSRLSDRLHGAVALLALWLIASSPWVAMLRRIPAGAGWVDYAHVAAGFAALLCGVVYGWACVRGGRWRLYFPLASAQLADAGRDLRGLLRGQVPAAEGGGLFGAIEGLLLVAFLVTALTGAVWFFAQGSAEAIAWRGHHIVAARALVGLLALHVVTVSLHLLDFVRD